MSRAQAEGKSASSEWRRLHRKIAKHFTLAELQELTHGLGMPFEELEGNSLTPKALALVTSVERHGRERELIEELREVRPNVKWPDAPGSKGEGKVDFPIFNVSLHRNPNFTGREMLLREVETTLAAGENTVVKQAIAGLGGVGKTQVALELCYRQRNVYDLVSWLPANDGTALATAYVALGEAVGLPIADEVSLADQVAATRRWLGETAGQWLLVFDNVDTLAPAEVMGYLPPGGRGRALITSRNPNWGGVAKQLTLQVWTQAEAEAFLAERLGHVEPEAGTLAEALGYLPLALEHAGAFMEASGSGAGEYLAIFEKERGRLWALVEPPDQYHGTITTTWEIAFERLQEENAAAIDLLDFCSFLAVDDIPVSMLREQAERLPVTMGELATDSISLNGAIGALRKYSLIERVGDKLALHRIVAAVVRERMPAEKRMAYAAAAVGMVGFLFPGQSKLHLWAEAERAVPNMIAAANNAEVLQVAAEDTALVNNRLGLYLRFRGEYARARPYYEQALAINEKALGPEHANTATSLNNLGSLLQAMGEPAEARPYYERALAINEKALGPEHANTATSLNNLGSLLQAMGELAEARPYLERALAIREKALGPEHPDTAQGLNNLGSLLKEMGELAEARPYLERALALCEKSLGPEHPNTATSLNNLGSLLHDMGELAEARPYLERALGILEKKLGPGNATTKIVRENLAQLGEEGERES